MKALLIQKIILEWFNGPQDYHTGVELLSKTTRKYRLLNRLLKGETKLSSKKLKWELSGVADLRYIPEPNFNSVKEEPAPLFKIKF